MKQAKPVQRAVRRREWAGLNALARITLAPTLADAIEQWAGIRAFRAEASNHLREVRRDCNPDQLRELAVDLGFNRVFACPRGQRLRNEVAGLIARLMIGDN